MIDNILVYGRTQEYDECLLRVLCRLQKEGLTFNRDKCKFSQRQVPFLGQVVNESGIRLDPEKVTAIRNVQVPTSVGEIQQYIRTVNQMSKFAPNFADITKL